MAPFWSVVNIDNGVVVRIGRLSRRRVELDQGHVAPELFQPVVAPGLGREDVQNDVEIVDEHPVALHLALDRAWPQLVLVLEALAHLVDDRLRLPRVTPAAQHEEVGIGADRPQIEDDDVLCQLLLSEAGDEASLFERCQSERILSRLDVVSLARGSAVQTSLLDLARNRWRNEVSDRLAAFDALSDLARRDRKLLDLEDLDVVGRN